jgi:chondroitin 4-sulfotransferase 11
MISHEFKTIFVHIPKTGGTSVEGMFGYAEYNKFGNLLKDNVGRGKHWGADEYYQYWSDWYKQYYKFTIVRNPWERELSLYLMMRGQLKYRHLNFRQFIQRVVKRNLEFEHEKFRNIIFRNQKDYIVHKNDIHVDQIIRHENLNEGWAEMCKKIKKPQEKLIHLRNSKRQHISNFYDQETIDLVAELRKEDIEFLNYDFSDAK